MACVLVNLSTYVQDRWLEGRDLNEKTLAADSGRWHCSENSVAYGCGVSGSTEK